MLKSTYQLLHCFCSGKSLRFRDNKLNMTSDCVESILTLFYSNVSRVYIKCEEIDNQ